MRGSNIVSVFELRAPDRLTAQCCQVSGLYEGFVLFLSSILICGCEVLFALFFVALFFFARSVVDRHSLCVVLDRCAFGVKPFVCGSKLLHPSNMAGRWLVFGLAFVCLWF